MRSLSRSERSFRRGRGRAAAVALVAGLALAGASLTAVPAEAVNAPHHSPNKLHSAFQKLAAAQASLHKTYRAGTYIVRLKAAPAATYEGGTAGYAATKPAAGTQLNAKASGVTRYSTHLRATQNSLTKKYGVKPFYNYTLAFNGFAAKLTEKQANALAKNPAVSTLSKNEKLKVQATDPTDPNINPLSSVNYLGIPGYVWGSGGAANAGKGVVLGDIDTGIAPENPSFAGDALGTAVTASTTPAIIDGGGVDTVQFKKADGGTFSSSIIPNGNGWTRSDLSTKIIAAHYFVQGFGVSNLGSTASRGEYVSPRDGAGHGSHTASTAAGDYSVSENVAGTDFGKISGVAPAAKIAVYKVCWDGVATDESQDGCATTDMVAAINQAVQDGVDVLNFSIGGSSAQTTFSPTDEAFFNASAAGIFVAAAGGNAGPGASTLDNASPWETTVAASTIPSYAATATFGEGGPAPIQGASNSVGYGSLAQVPDGSAFVDAEDSGVSGADATALRLCGPNTLSSAAVTGKVVLCDRGTYDRVAKSAEVKRAGGIGMVLLNTPTGAQDTDLDLHSVPTIHINASPSSVLATYQAAYDAIHTYAQTSGATVSFAKTADASPVPQIAGFSSHGPVLADGSDILKPDVSAPGVSILAAVANAPGASPNWDFYSGTSMATPHVAGLALLYLGKHPKASTSEIQSALMTTATNTKTATGGTVTDPFAQGNGEVNPSKYLNPGLLYLSTKSDWSNYLYSVGEVDHTTAGFEKAKKIDPSNLNHASIAIGDFAGIQKVTRTVTAQSAGTYKASVSLKGIKAVISPATLKFTKVGQSKSFSITFVRTSAPLDEYSTGFLTWKKSGSSTTVRSAIAIHPTALQAAAEVDGTGTTGSVKTTVKAGAKLKVVTVPLLAGSEVTDAKSSANGQYTATATSGGHAQYSHVVAPATEDAGGSEYLRFNVHPVPAQDAATDLDLYVFYYPTGTAVPTLTSADLDTSNPDLVGYSATGANDETVEYFPTEDQYNDGGTYVTYVDYFAVPTGGVNYAETFTNLTDTSDEGDFHTTPSLFSTATSNSYSIKFSWAGLNPDALYSGFVFYYNASSFNYLNGTFVQVDTTTPVSARS